jgi:hypothetical protein
MGCLGWVPGMGGEDWKRRKQLETPARFLRKQRRVSSIITSDEGLRGDSAECCIDGITLGTATVRRQFPITRSSELI